MTKNAGSTYGVCQVEMKFILIPMSVCGVHENPVGQNYKKRQKAIHITWSDVNSDSNEVASWTEFLNMASTYYYSAYLWPSNIGT